MSDIERNLAIVASALSNDDEFARTLFLAWSRGERGSGSEAAKRLVMQYLERRGISGILAVTAAVLYTAGWMHASARIAAHLRKE